MSLGIVDQGEAEMISPRPYRNDAALMMQLGFSCLAVVLGLAALAIGGARRNELFASKREIREAADVFEYTKEQGLFHVGRDYQLIDYSCDKNNPPKLRIKGFFTNEVDEVRVFDKDGRLIGFYTPETDVFDFKPHPRCEGE
ncbi:hypothetical protein D0962_23060 [Leptolyngbyaceae cyanobacterium CCMR0082]|uniref:Uncharacterized protein n=2 Tax=Adonisia TaxID=2950183 RepID=A0A6M0SAW0_9CYAN|nr:hypothetical protein [Adonisia turfae CCMR0082]